MYGYGVDYNSPRPPFILAKLLWRYLLDDSPLGWLFLRPLLFVFSMMKDAVQWSFTADDGGGGGQKFHDNPLPSSRKWIREAVVGIGADEYL